MNLSFVPIIPVSTSSLDLLHVYSLSQYPTKSLFAPKIKKNVFHKNKKWANVHRNHWSFHICIHSEAFGLINS